MPYHYKRLKDLREDKELNQEDIAKIIETTPQYYSAYERGIRDIPFSRIIKIAKFYKVSIDYIAELTNKNNNNLLSNDEKEILKKWSELSERNKGKVELLIEQLQEEQAKSKEAI